MFIVYILMINVTVVIVVSVNGFSICVFVWIFPCSTFLYSSTLCNIQLFLKSRSEFVNNLKPKMVNEQSEPFPPLWARRGAHIRSVKLPKITLVLAIVK